MTILHSEPALNSNQHTKTGAKVGITYSYLANGSYKICLTFHLPLYISMFSLSLFLHQFWMKPERLLEVGGWRDRPLDTIFEHQSPFPVGVRGPFLEGEKNTTIEISSINVLIGWCSSSWPVHSGISFPYPIFTAVCILFQYMWILSHGYWRISIVYVGLYSPF